MVHRRWHGTSACSTGDKPVPDGIRITGVARLYWLALGTFAIGTEGFMIAPLLPDLAGDLSVSLVTAGQLVTVFALTYALSSPVLTALTGDIDRRRLLIGSMLALRRRIPSPGRRTAIKPYWWRAFCSPSRLASMSPMPMPWRAPSSSRHGAAPRYQS
jgi:MFS family permease